MEADHHIWLIFDILHNNDGVLGGDDIVGDHLGLEEILKLLIACAFIANHCSLHYRISLFFLTHFASGIVLDGTEFDYLGLPAVDHFDHFAWIYFFLSEHCDCKKAWECVEEDEESQEELLTHQEIV